MPLIDSNLASLWDGGDTSLYRVWNGDNPPTYSGYVRGNMQAFMGNDADALIAALESKGLTKGQRVVLIGAGFGWVAERFIALGYGPMSDGTANGKIGAVDTSTWIQANKGNGNATVTILNVDVNASTGRRTIKQQFGSTNAVVDWIVSEDVLPILSDAECGIFASAIRQLATNIAHWVSVGTVSGDLRLNWKTLAQWKALVSSDLVIHRGTATVL